MCTVCVSMTFRSETLKWGTPLEWNVMCGVLPCVGVCAILASRARTVKISISRAIRRPVSMMGSA
jgi:hypothetical protein